MIIVKENRTYDEVFGPGGCFGPVVTLNHQEIARRWATGDNFYADSEVSVDGHHWLVGAYINAWTETSLMGEGLKQREHAASRTCPCRIRCTAIPRAPTRSTT